MAESGRASRQNQEMAGHYLSLNRLTITELPAHPDLEGPHIGRKPSVKQFLEKLLAEIQLLDFDADFTSRGKWSPAGMTVEMPAGSHKTKKSVPVSVDKRVKKDGKESWCGRTSFHQEGDVKYAELDALLSHDHSLNEARYTPSVYDANRLLKWEDSHLQGALDVMGGGRGLEGVQMSVFEMFHEMPKIGPLSLLNDRVFHLLVVTVHTTHFTTGESRQPVKVPQSFTAQLPVDFDSLSQIPAIQKRSHMQKQGSSIRYNIPLQSATPKQRKKGRAKLVEGNYVSLERLRKALKILPGDEAIVADAQPANPDYQHRWDMMTLSTAGGVTRIAPRNKTQNETLEAIAADVEYVLKYIAEQRQAAS